MIRNYGARFDHVAVRDGDTIPLGACELRFIHTPGHTIESMCVALIDPAISSAPCAVFTGDTLFVGDVGHPDLAPDHTPHELAGNIGLSGQYASWAARIVGLHSAVVLVADDSERAHEAYVRLTRVGMERISGYLAGA